MWVFREGFTLYHLISYFTILGVLIYYLYPLPQILKEPNIIIFNYNNGHWFSQLAIVTVIAVYGYNDIIRGIYAGGFIYAVHELGWIITNTIMVFPTQAVDVALHYYPLIGVLSFLLLGYFMAFRSLPRRKEAIIVGAIAIYLVFWAAAGWQVSVENYLPDSKTIYFTVAVVNLVEVLGWVSPALFAILP